MKILITGSNGFLGKNLKELIYKFNSFTIIDFNKNDNLDDFDFSKIEFVIHLAAVHRTNNEEDFNTYNVEFTKKLILKCSKFNIPIIYTSSIQSNTDTPYGRSKRICEELISEYRKTSKYSKIFRLTNTFGEYSQVNKQSVVANFCYNLSHNKECFISNPEVILNLTYIKDVVFDIFKEIKLSENEDIISVEPVYNISLKELFNTIKSIKENEDVFIDYDFFLKLKKTYKYFEGLD